MGASNCRVGIYGDGQIQGYEQQYRANGVTDRHARGTESPAGAGQFEAECR